MAWTKRKYERLQLPLVVDQQLRESFYELTNRVTAFEDTSEDGNMELTWDRAGDKRLMLMFSFKAADKSTRAIQYRGAGIDVYERLKDTELNRARDAVEAFIKDIGFQASRAFVGKGYVSYYVGPDWFVWNRRAREVYDGA